MNSSSRSRGFSLIEVIVSILFLSIAIAGLMTTYTYLSSRIEMMRWKQSALHLAQEKIEEYMANPNYTDDPNQAVEIYFTPSIVKLTKDSSDRSIECKITIRDKKDVSVSLKTILGK